MPAGLGSAQRATRPGRLLYDGCPPPEGGAAQCYNRINEKCDWFVNGICLGGRVPLSGDSRAKSAEITGGAAGGGDHDWVHDCGQLPQQGGRFEATGGNGYGRPIIRRRNRFVPSLTSLRVPRSVDISQAFENSQNREARGDRNGSVGESAKLDTPRTGNRMSWAASKAVWSRV